MTLTEWFHNIPRGLLPHKLVLIKPGQTIFSQGEECNRVFYLSHGIVRLSTVSPEGRSVVVGLLTTGDLVGVESLAGELQHQTTATALVPSSAVRMRTAALMRLLHRQLPTATTFVQYLLRLYVRVQGELINYLTNTSEKRLARALLLLDDYSRSVDRSILATITQDALADIVGTTRSRVSFFMNRFRNTGYIDYDTGGLKIRRSLAEVLDYSFTHPN